MSTFQWRHIGPGPVDQEQMLAILGANSLEHLIDEAVPETIRMRRPLQIPPARSEQEALSDLRDLAKKNKVTQSYQGMGYSPCIIPGVIQRNVLENPGWYTQYTPYQAEISQGRLEALIGFQTMVCDLTGLPVSNASLLDEGTALAEAMMLSFSSRKKDGKKFFVSNQCHPQSIAVVRTRAEPIGIQIEVGDPRTARLEDDYFAAALQYPATDGNVEDWASWVEKAHKQSVLVVVATDLLALTLLKPPGEFGADIAVGSAQRFGVSMGFGGPHAAFMATREEFTRKIPGRLIGVSKDIEGRNAYRLSLQTREQHIRREKATSNICTAQVLLAIMASFYAVYHGPKGLRAIAENIHRSTVLLAQSLKALGLKIRNEGFFDTLRVSVSRVDTVRSLMESNGIDLRYFENGDVGISLHERTQIEDLRTLVAIFAKAEGKSFEFKGSLPEVLISRDLKRTSEFLTHEVFNLYHSETEMLRYIKRLESKDLSLAHSMIPLGSCTMKLNATTEMVPVTWAEFADMHPFTPSANAGGYLELFNRLEKDLAEMTGFAAVSLQPNAGSQGEYAGLLVIRQFHLSRGDTRRNVCLIPRSAHGTNPASAALAGMQVVVVECDRDGNVDLEDLKLKATAHAQSLSALMVTYPSTHGVFEESIRDICDVIHSNGGLVYMDGANMNAQIGLCRPGDFGPDVCHLNLHKTFCIPHGGGGPGMGPIGVTEKLAEFLPGKGPKSIGPVSSAQWGSASILPIPYAYIRMMGPDGLKHATEVAILSANYVAKRLEPYFPVLYKGKRGRVAHECILDLRPLKQNTGIEVEDVAKRLMDYGFHAPTISFPVPGTVMIEPTESESKAELDRFCDAMISIREEIREIEQGKADVKNNVLKGAPHTATTLTADVWDRPYSRTKAAFPLAWVRGRKFWPSVSRIDAVAGDRNFVCTCPPMDSYT